MRDSNVKILGVKTLFLHEFSKLKQNYGFVRIGYA
ncbi:MAG: hypothetical protein UZ08_BCD001001855 [Candidatus Parvibacillus calidus]|jgi:hypothetical protein|nr:MAG: hypothetical protein UZ08_BCD001001855 [Candidatus Parvibacillus calidus]